MYSITGNLNIPLSSTLRIAYPLCENWDVPYFLGLDYYRHARGGGHPVFVKLVAVPIFPS